MGLFDTLLKEHESLFIDTMPLDVDYTPPLIKFREQEQHQIAACIKPLLQHRSGKNVLVMGSPGIGKTVAVKAVLEDLQKQTDEVYTLYVNCWKKDTSYKIALDICQQLGFTFVHNRDTSDLFQEIAKILNKKCAVLVLDEVDMLTDQQVFYHLMEEVYKKTIVMITNDVGWLSTLDSRVKSRLLPEEIDFRTYTATEIKGILQERVRYAFVPNVFVEEAFSLVVAKTTELEDVRIGLRLLREAGEMAEQKASRKILPDHVAAILTRFDGVKKKSEGSLTEGEDVLLKIVQQHSGKTAKQLFDVYSGKGGDKSYSTFHRTLKHLEDGGFLSMKEVSVGNLAKGQKGRTTLVYHNSEVKKLTDF